MTNLHTLGYKSNGNQCNYKCAQYVNSRASLHFRDIINYAESIAILPVFVEVFFDIDVTP